MIRALTFCMMCVLGTLPFSGCGLLAPIVGPVSETTTSNVDQAKDEGYIQFNHIVAGDRIFLDGTAVGTGEAYQAGGQLGVSPGTHEIEVRTGDVVRLKQKVFIGTGSTRTIDLR